MLLRDDHKMTLSILMNVLVIDSTVCITSISASYRNFASCLVFLSNDWVQNVTQIIYNYKKNILFPKYFLFQILNYFTLFD